MSQIAVAGLSAIAEGTSRRDQKRFLEADKEGVLESSRAVQSLPAGVATTLKRMRAHRDPLLSPYLAALHDAGWSLGALSEPLGVSRQAIHIRMKSVDRETLGDFPLPNVPKPLWRPSVPSDKPASEMKDWPVWVDRDIYTVVAQDARRQGTPMRLVMEGILRDYLAGKVKIE